MEKFTYYSRSVPSFTAMSSYSCLFLASSSRQPKQVSPGSCNSRSKSLSCSKKKIIAHIWECKQQTVINVLCLNIHTMQMRHVQTWTSLIFYHFALNIASSTYDFTCKCFFQGDFKRIRKQLTWHSLMGVLPRRTSIPVVCPLQRGVSRQTSASWPLRTCSSLGATGEKMMRFLRSPYLYTVEY